MSKRVDVHVEYIRWMNGDGQELSEAEQAALLLPTEETLVLDGSVGIWTDSGLEDQCAEVLNKKYVGTGMEVADLLAEVV